MWKPTAVSTRVSLSALVPLTLLSLFGCGAAGGDGALSAERPLHLEDYLSFATIEGSEVPTDAQQAVTWEFDQPQPDWKVVDTWEENQGRTRLSRTDDALRVSLGDVDVTDEENNRGWGAIYIDVPDWTRDDWASVRVRLRAEAEGGFMGTILAFNLRERSPEDEDRRPTEFMGENLRVIADGTVQTYNLRADWSQGRWKGPWKQLVLGFWAQEPLDIDILSIAAIPKEATYASDGAGVHSEVKDRMYVRSLYAHTPARMAYPVRIPPDGRLDLRLGVMRGDAPVTFRVISRETGADEQVLFEEAYADKDHWARRSVDLSHLSDRNTTLVLEAESDRPGTVALWGSPTLTGAATSGKPNVIFYVIDGAAADFMSVYGYNRRTTPNLERLAAEGTLFEWAYSNSTWTKPSTASFMTSLQNSVMGGQTNWTDPVPEQIRTMAEHMHAAGHQTAVLVANPNAGTLSNLQRGVDFMKESWEEFAYLGRENHKESSRIMHQRFLEWREAFPGRPYWVHFQTTDVHGPQNVAIAPPFRGLFVSPEQREEWTAWRDTVYKTEGGRGPWGEAWEKTGVDRVAFFTVWQGLYDESMAFNDHQLGRLVEHLKDNGDWENTLLIIAGDHSVRSAGSDQGVALQDSVTPPWNQTILRSTVSRVPLIFIWPGHIRAGQRLREPVSMLDVLPTVLDLMDLPRPEVMMGQSLAPLLRGEGGWEPRPVVLDEFQVDPETHELRGRLEVIDGRWGASLEINPWPVEEDEDEDAARWRRPVPLLLFDLWEDPFALHSVHERYPDRVEHYTAFLEEQWAAHQSLAQYFTQEEEIVMSADQLETLRSLGYIQ